MIRDYLCQPGDADQRMLDIIQNNGLPVPEIYLEKEEILRFAILEKEAGKKPFCTLPPDHTLEAEAMGGIVRYGNGTAGPRAREAVCRSLEDLRMLSAIDYSKGRIKDVLDVCGMLRAQGEEVVFQMSGPLTIWNTLIDLKEILKGIRKAPDDMENLFGRMEEELLLLLEEIKKRGVRLISYADSAGGLQILGPKSMEWMTRNFTHSFLKKAEKMMGQEMAMILCPKTGLALTGTELAVQRELSLPGEMTYQEACMYAVGKASFLSQMCLNRGNAVIKNGKLMTIQLI